MSKVGILGGGSWGTALANLVGCNGHDVLHWMRDRDAVSECNGQRTNTRYLPGLALSNRIEATSDLARVGQECRLILVVIPSQSLRMVVGELGNHLDGGHLLVHATKGFETGTFKRMSVIIREETCTKKIGVLSGPNLAKEIAEGQPSATVVASKYKEVIEASRQVLVGPTFRVYGSSDVIGAETGGALKNILAIASGLAVGLGFGDNTKAMLLTRGLAEISRLGIHLGAHPATFSGLSGIGDLMATCFSPLSRNFQVGARLAKGESMEQIVGAMNQVAEGIKTTRAVHEYGQANGLYLPITEGVHRILYDGVSPRLVLAELMESTRFMYEVDPEIGVE
ncbi:MAG: Glycerol-3-phosphate dehydrogenase [Cyanobacteria bacterium RYN_339]|nr:Glycerol-3-phosphate dehydrogenase [Cyanobacteria bacterium RYN_339]